MFKRNKRAPESWQKPCQLCEKPGKTLYVNGLEPDFWRCDDHPPITKTPTREFCDICGEIAVSDFRRCERHIGVVFESHAITDAPETRGA